MKIERKKMTEKAKRKLEKRKQEKKIEINK